jgi:hypothetical protein
MAKTANNAPPEGGGGEFGTFLRAVRAFIPPWCEQVRSQSAEKDRDPGMRLYEEAILNAWDGAAHELSQIYQRLDPEARAELDRSVRVSGMLVLVERATSLVSSGQLVSAAALLDLGTIIEKIKWFISCILDCLGIPFPCLLWCLFNLLDNFFRLFVGPVSRDYARYYFEIEWQASEVRMQMLREQKLRKGCSCGGASDRD